MSVLCSAILPQRNPGIHPRHDLSPIGTFDLWKKVLHCKDCQVYGLILRISRDIETLVNNVRHSCGRLVGFRLILKSKVKLVSFKNVNM